jgi:hypothetical protein
LPVALFVVLTLLVDLTGSTAGGFHILLDGRARMAMEAALEGARARLSRPRCEKVFADFLDQDGRLLSENLRLAGLTAAEHLAALYFVEADERRCRADEATTAFTTPGSRVIHVCAARFAGRFALKTRDGELLVIHELLHALGLGENPPRSSDITARVRGRCGK